MGTNYYVRLNECKHCNRGEELHLGKYSCGWSFCFRWNEEHYKTLDELKGFLKNKQIWDEYDRKVSKKYFWELIEGSKIYTEASEERIRNERYPANYIRVDGFRWLDNEFF